MITEIDKPFIQYSLSKSRTFQSVGQRGVRKSWDKIKTFLSTWTTANPEQPCFSEWCSIDFTIFNDYEDKLSDEICTNAISLADKAFGKGQVRKVGLLPSTTVKYPKEEVRWKINIAQFNECVMFLLNGEPWPSQRMGPIELLFSYDFQLKNVSYKDYLYKSDIMVGLSQKSVVTPVLNFPFEEPTQEFWDYVAQIEPNLPFKWDVNNLRLMKPNKKRTGLIASKL
jgi:hypothetical protein